MVEIGQKIILEQYDETLIGSVTSLLEDKGFVAKIGELYYPFIFIGGVPYPLLKNENGDYMPPEEIMKYVTPSKFLLQ